MTERDGGSRGGGSDARSDGDAPAPGPHAAERTGRMPEPAPVTRGSHDLPPRPRVETEDGILGFSRVTRGRFGAKLFTLFFVAVYAVIALNLVISLLSG